MSDLIDTTEMYLRTIYEMVEDGVIPMRARIAEQLGHSGPTVSQTVARMERDGLVVVNPDDRRLDLTEDGMSQAVRVMRKHRLAERLLTDVIGLELTDVHDEACRWEHVISDRVERRLLEMLPDTARSPYGNPIPGLSELGGGDAPADPAGTISVCEATSQGPMSATLVRIGEVTQTVPGFLVEAEAVQLRPGVTVDITPIHNGANLTTSSGEVVIDVVACRHVFVVPN